MTITGGPGGGFRFSRKSGGTSSSGGVGTVRYPSPFFDIASTYLPSTIKQLFGYCRYYMMTSPLISTVINKMALYPVTDLAYETPDEGLKAKWRDMLSRHFRIRSFLIDANLDRECYGNAFISLFFPFKKFLKCRNCGDSKEIGKASYRFRTYQYWLSCRECSHTGPAAVLDNSVRSSRGVRLIRWDPESISLDYNPVTQETRYYYKLSSKLRNDITMGKKTIIETVPHSFVRALELGKALELASDNIYHYKRSSISHADEGWGIPRILPVLKDAYFLQILKKSQEMIAQEHIVPLRVLFPQPGSATSDPYANIQVSSWTNQVREQIERWKNDGNYIPIFPLPIGNQTIGGDAKALMLHDEIRVWSEQIVAGMGVPQEFVMGGLSYSGSSVSLRMLENEFLGHREDMLGLLEFVVNKVSLFMDWTPVKVRLTPFKMADDLQRAAFDLQLNMANKISDSSMLASRDYDYPEQVRMMEGESRQKANIQRQIQTDQAIAAGEAMLVQSRYQLKAQQAQARQQPPMGPEGMPGGMPPEGQPPEGAPPEGQPAQGAPMEGEGGQPPGVLAGEQSPINSEVAAGGGFGMDFQQMAEQTAAYLRQLDPQTQAQELTRLKAEQPEIHKIVFMLLNTERPADNGSAGRPLPEKKPPRRGADTALI